jgi:hypothetical protein
MRSSGVVLATLTLLALTALEAAGKSAPPGDRPWTTPDIARFPVASIAMLPPATYDGNAEASRLVEQAVGQALRGSGHRWVSPFLVRDVLLKNGGDSLSKAINAKLLQDPRVDSLDAPRLSRLFRARALLTVRVDEMERRELERTSRAGRPRRSSCAWRSWTRPGGCCGPWRRARPWRARSRIPMPTSSASRHRG